jgi:hypothetical protein
MRVEHSSSFVPSEVAKQRGNQSFVDRADDCLVAVVVVAADTNDDHDGTVFGRPKVDFDGRPIGQEQRVHVVGVS